MHARTYLAAFLQKAGRGAFWVEFTGWAALVAFTVISVGAPLLGDGTFLGTQLLTTYAPWSSTLHSVTPITNGFVGDTINSATPQVALIVDAARHGVFGQWNPYLSGGTQLGGLPNSGIYSPLSLPWWFLPLTYAPGAVKVLEIAAVTVGMSLFLRRLHLPRATWPLASLVFASSGFMVAWTNWPQTRVAAFIPLLFWAVDRAAVRRRPLDAIAVGAVVAAILLGGFPEVAGFAVYAAGAYAVYRTVTESRRARKIIAGVAVNAAGLIIGFLLAAWQMVPFVVNASSFIDFAARANSAVTPSSWPELASALVPNAVGFSGSNPIEDFTYLGAATVVLIAAAALIRPRSGARRSGLIFFAVLLAVCIVIVFAGSPIVNVVEKLPVFSSNPVGRLRCIIGFAGAIVAAFGFGAVLDARPARSNNGDVRAAQGDAGDARAAQGGVGDVRAAQGETEDAHVSPLSSRLRLARRSGAAAVLVVSVVVVLWAFMVAPSASVRDLAVETAAVVVIGLVATAAISVAWVTKGRRAIIVAGILIPVLVAAPAVYVTGKWWPKSELSTFYPQTATHEFLEKNLGEERYASVDQTMLPGSNSLYQLRSLGGHTFPTAEWKALLLKIDPESMASPTFSTLDPANLDESITSPLMDRLGVKYVVSDPNSPVVGDTQPGAPASSTVSLRSGGSVQSSVFTGPVNGITFDVPTAPSAASAARATPAETPDGVWLTTTLTNAATGKTITSTRTWYSSFTGTRNVAIEGDDIPSTEAWIATIRITGQDGGIPVGTLADGSASVGLVRTANGVRIVHTGDSTIYLRTTALERVRWASQAVVEPDASKRIDLLDSPTLSSKAVVLDSRSAARSSDAESTAHVSELSGTLNQVRVSVTSDGSGWVVVDDSLRAPGWTATVDGVPTRLVTADEAGGAVHVTAGHHTVVLEYQTPGLNEGIAISLVTAALIILGGIVTAGLRRRRRRRGLRDQPLA